MSGLNLSGMPASASSTNDRKLTTTASHNGSIGRIESPPAHALRLAWEMYDKMPSAQRTQMESQLAGSRFATDDKTPPHVKMMAEKIHNRFITQRIVPAPRAPMAPSQRQHLQPPPVQPASHMRTPPNRRPNQLLHAQLQPGPKPTILLPTAQQQQKALPLNEQELQARQWLANGVLLDGQTPTSVCLPHQQQVRDLQAWGNVPAGSFFDLHVPAAPEVFRETITSGTALLPMCNGCAIKDGAITVTVDAQGQFFYHVQVLDKCTCACSVTRFTQTTNQTQDCWFCELGRIEAAKQVAVKKRVLKMRNGEPVLMDPTKHVALSCACGGKVDLPEVVRKCVGCGGIKTQPFLNYSGDELDFLEVSDRVGRVLDPTTGQPYPARAMNGIPASISQHQLPAVRRSAPNGGLSPLSIRPASDFEFPFGQNLDEKDHERQLQDDTQRGKKRTAAQAYVGASASQAKRPDRKPKTSRFIDRPPPGQKTLFESEEAGELMGIGLKVYYNYQPKGLIISPARRAETLLRDNLEHLLGTVGVMAAMLVCGFGEQDALAVMENTPNGYGGIATGAQILNVLKTLGMLAGNSKGAVPVNGHGPSQKPTALGHVSLHPLFNTDDKIALMELGFDVAFNGQADPSNASPAYRAEVLLKDNINRKTEAGKLNEALRVCGLEGWRLQELMRDISDNELLQHVRIADVMARMRTHGMLASGALPAPVAMSANVLTQGAATSMYQSQQQTGDLTATTSAQQLAKEEWENDPVDAFINADATTLQNVYGMDHGETNAGDSNIDPALLGLPYSARTTTLRTLPTTDTPAPQQTFAFSADDLQVLGTLGLHNIPAADVIASLPTAAKRAEAVLKSHESSNEELNLEGFALMLQMCGYAEEEATRMADDYTAYGGSEEKCSDYLEFFEGDFA
ncbi:hypothetical protein LTR85_010627 [Meristemomyces frigidus]|nr:hypothetical protein LTR85_010627 [Meristemomyces frigidus]